MKTSTSLPGGCTLIELPEAKDTRGSLAFFEAGVHIPFAVQRVFWIYNVPDGQTRGGHAHRTCAEVVFPVAGSFDMEVDDGHTRCTVHMDKPNVGILIPAGVWCSLKNFARGTVCVAAASQPYMAEGYINNHEEYLRQKQ